MHEITSSVCDVHETSPECVSLTLGLTEWTGSTECDRYGIVLTVQLTMLFEFT